MKIPSFDAGYRPQGYARNEIGCWTGLLARPEYFSLDIVARKAVCWDDGKGFPPAEILGVDCVEAGNRLQYDYHRGGSSDDKAVADAVYLHNLRVLIRKGGWLLRAFRLRRAAQIYRALRYGEYDNFNYTAK
ncbi:MAG: hypothetical protein J5654_08690 [Victivallales bacterium]|nr:hypothetical protein [Victivallales bacterium]MBR5704496.1 hypothetical protein [Deltaproteobacteria bacterium]